MRISCRIVITLAILIAAASAVSADQYTQTETFGGIPDFTSILTFNKLELAPGDTLNWISVELILNVNGGQYVLDNDADTPASGSFSFGGKSLISASSIPMLDELSNPVAGTVQSGHTESFELDPNIGDGLGDYSPDPPDGMVYQGGSESASDSGYIGSFLFTQYLGTGTFTVTVDTSQWAMYTGASGIEAGITPVSADGSVRIVYDYSPVPEPASLLSLIGGIGFLGLFRRRR